MFGRYVEKDSRYTQEFVKPAGFIVFLVALT